MRSGQIVILNMIGFSLGLLPPHLSAEEAVKNEAEVQTPAANKTQTKSAKPKTNKKAGSTATLKTSEDKGTKKKSSVQVWLSKLKKKMAATQNKHNKLVAVAAVRGDETSDSPPLYWKGKSGDGPVSIPELKEFDDAVNLALNGDNAGAKLGLESFLSSHPDSHMREDAQQTLNMLNEETITP